MQLNALSSCTTTLSAAARLVYSARRSEDVSPLLRHLHWLRCARLPLPEWHSAAVSRQRNQARCRHGLTHAARSASTVSLHVPWSSHATIGDRAFPVAAATVWNSLPKSVTSLESLLAFRQAMKAELFQRSQQCVTTVTIT